MPFGPIVNVSPIFSSVPGDLKATHCVPARRYRSGFLRTGEVQVSINQRKYVLAVDLGTSGPKVALVSTDGEVVGHEFEETPILLLPNGGAEQRPDDWWNATKAACQRLLATRVVPVDDIVAINCTTQWSGTVAVDREQMPTLRPGATATARIHCGRRPVGYVWFRGLLEWFQSRVLFRL